MVVDWQALNPRTAVPRLPEDELVSRRSLCDRLHDEQERLLARLADRAAEVTSVREHLRLCLDEPQQMGQRLRSMDEALAQSLQRGLIAEDPLQRAQTLAEQHQADIQALHTFASWRITAPLRRLSSLLRGDAHD